MSQIKREPTESEDSNHSTSEWSLDTSTIGEGNDVNELKLKMAVLETTVQMLQAKVQMLEVTNKNLQEKSHHEQNQKQNLQVSRFTFSKANGNRWTRSPAGGLRAINPNPQYSQGFVAKQGFLISGKHFRKGAGGTILYYYEVTHVNMPLPFPGAILMSSQFKQYSVGLSNGINPDDKILVGHIPNSYAIQNGNHHFFLSQTDNDFEWPEGTIRPKWNGIGDVAGCGVLLSPADDRLSIFFTLNGILMESSTLPCFRYRKLPAELNREIFLCFNPTTQRKFIWGLGWGFYAMFRYKLLKKTKRVCNPHGNRFNRTNTRATVAADGLKVSNNTVECPIVYAEQPFPISGQFCRVDDFPGTILYYYEVKGNMWTIGLSDGAIFDISSIREYSNSYTIPNYINFHDCWLAGERHQFEVPEGVIRPRWKYNSINVFGCGVVLDSEDKLAIFFTLNGQLIGRKIPFNPTVVRLFPTVTMMLNDYFETNFGDDPANPFEYDIQKCPGLELACI